MTYQIRYIDDTDELSGITPTSYNTALLPLTLNPTTPIKSGYSFVGWCESSDLSGECSTSNITLTKGSKGTKKFYAKWTAE